MASPDFILPIGVREAFRIVFYNRGEENKYPTPFIFVPGAGVEISISTSRCGLLRADYVSHGSALGSYPTYSV